MPPTIVETDLKEILGSIQKDLKDIREDLSYQDKSA
jgi:cob(I)alamin adenosyltransferase